MDAIGEASTMLNSVNYDCDKIIISCYSRHHTFLGGIRGLNDYASERR